jgi:glycosyltransferase involved in cell wall biosynthesis
MITRLTTGSAAATVALCAGLQARDGDVTLVYGRNPPHEPAARALLLREDIRGIGVDAMGPRMHGLSDARALWLLRRAIDRLRPDIVHTHTAKAGALGRVAACLATRPRPVIVHTFHGHVLTNYFGTATSAGFRLIERGLARLTDRIITPSEATARELVGLRVVRKGQCVVIPYGFDLDAFSGRSVAERSKVREELKIPMGTVVLLFSGRLAPIKRLDVLIEAAAILRQQGLRFQLLIAGEGECRGELERLTDDRDLASAITFLGHREDVASVTRAADVAVLASDNEGLPIALIEAGAAGLPAVGTRAGGTPEVVTRETGILVPPRDPQALASAIGRLIEDDGLRSALGRAARERTLRVFGREAMVDATERLYADLLAEKRSRYAGAKAEDGA